MEDSISPGFIGKPGFLFAFIRQVTTESRNYREGDKEIKGDKEIYKNFIS